MRWNSGRIHGGFHRFKPPNTCISKACNCRGTRPGSIGTPKLKPYKNVQSIKCNYLKIYIARARYIAQPISRWSWSIGHVRNYQNPQSIVEQIQWKRTTNRPGKHEVNY